MVATLHINIKEVSLPYYPKRAQAYRTDRFTGWLDGQPRLALEALSSLVRITPVQ